jgi:hypothetical protein
MICACTVPVMSPEIKFRSAEAIITPEDISSYTGGKVPEENRSGPPMKRYLLG